MFWFVESIEWNDDYIVFMVVFCKDVIWSDGEFFIVDDIVYSYEFVFMLVLDIVGFKF